MATATLVFHSPAMKINAHTTSVCGKAANVIRLATPRSGTSRSKTSIAVQTPARPAPAAPDADHEELERLHSSDAFAELVKLNRKQAVNRPQKVCQLV